MNLISSLALACFISLIRATAANHLFLQPPIRDRSEKLKFGQATCISNDGQRIAIGANGYDKFRGALYVYDLATGSGDRIDNWRTTRLVGNDTRPAEEKKPRELRVVERGSGFGFSCAITPSGHHLVVGAPGHALQRGAIYVYSYKKSRRSWTETSKLEVPDLKSGDLFGWVVVISQDCQRIVASAKGRRANNGEVFTFSCQVGCIECRLSSRLTPPEYTDSAGPRGIRIRNNFGISLDMNQEGTLLTVGCIGYREESGAAYIYGLGKDKKWSQVQKVESPNSQKFGFFGYKVAFDNDGLTLAVSADGEKEYTGAVYVFRKKTSHMFEADFEFVQEVSREKTNKDENFGGSIALSGDGRALLIGAPGKSSQGLKDHGVSYLYEEVIEDKGSTWELAETVGLPSAHYKAESLFGWTVGFSANGGRFVAAAPNSNGGAGLVAFGNFQLAGKWVPKSEKDVKNNIKDEL